MTATIVAAELQVSRGFDSVLLGVFKISGAANAEIIVFSRGRQLALMSSPALLVWLNRLWVRAPVGATVSSAESLGFDGLTIKMSDFNKMEHRGWGLQSGADQTRKLEALRDSQSFPPSLHLLAWRIGAWPAMPAGTQSDMS